MKKTLMFLLVLFFHVNSFTQTKNELPYTADLGNGMYQNPILAGDYADPSILRDGDDFYLTHSSFYYCPGLMVWHSKDLVNWQPIGHALRQYLGSVWAPELIKHKDKYYIYFPIQGTNYVVTADSPAGPWSDPVEIKVEKIDPGHVVGPDGTRYLYFSGGYYVELSDDGLSAVSEMKQVYEGWPIPQEWLIQCMCLESPKIIYHDGYYHLIVAQGGTAGPPTAHMVVTARSKSPTGPWENSPYNPIVHTWSSSEKWWAKGHGSMVQDLDDKWWIVYHGYENGYYTLGRQILMEPIEWTADGWPRVPATIRTDLPIQKPAGLESHPTLTLSDDFSNQSLGYQWTFFKAWEPDRFRIKNGSLFLDARGNSPKDSSPMLCMPAHHSYEAQVEFEITGEASAGLLLFYSEKAYAGIATDGQKISQYRRAVKGNAGQWPYGKHGFLKLVNNTHTVAFYYSQDGKVWKKLDRSIQTDSYHHNAFGDFLALRIGLVSMGSGTVRFDNFKYYGY